MEYWSGGEKPPQLLDEPPRGGLPPGQVHAWWLKPPRGEETPIIEQFAAFTSEAEQQRAARFHSPADRWAYLSAHSLLRWVLANQLDCKPTALQFRRNAYGRLFLETPASNLFFSLTHSRSMVACALAHDIAVGIDVEDATRQVHIEELARSYFAPNEIAHLSTLPSLVRSRDFLIQWTLKESFLKAISMGLHASVDTLSIIPEAKTLRVSFTQPFPESPTGWGFAALTELHGHHLAVAIRSEIPKITIRLAMAPCLWKKT